MGKIYEKNRVYLDSYVVQKDNRIRLPRGVEENLDVVPGVTYFDIYLDVKSNEIILKKAADNQE
jgi:hypothetical protein